MPRISILLPCRNAAAHLAAAIASIQQQTYTDYEVIAIDDGSSDATLDLLTGWAERDERVRVLPGAGAGIVAALCQAAAAASGELLARMDADDVARPARLERQVTFLAQHPAVGACGTRVRYFPDEIVRAGARRYEHWLNSLATPEQVDRDLFVECPIAHPALVMRRSVFDVAGGYQDHGWPEDYDLVLRMRATGALLANVPEVLLEWREGDTRLSRTAGRYGEWQFQRCKAHHLVRMRGDRRDFVVWGAGPVGKRFARALHGEGAHITAFVDLDPRKIGQVIHGARVIAPEGIADVRNRYVVAAVAGAAARAEIRAALVAARLVEVNDFCAVA